MLYGTRIYLGRAYVGLCPHILGSPVCGDVCPYIGVPHSVGMHPCTLRYPVIRERIPIYLGAPAFGNMLQYIGAYQHGYLQQHRHTWHEIEKERERASAYKYGYLAQHEQMDIPVWNGHLLMLGQITVFADAGPVAVLAPAEVATLCLATFACRAVVGASGQPADLQQMQENVGLRKPGAETAFR